MGRRRRDLPAVTLRVTRAGFEPVSAFDQEMHSRYRLGSIVEADLHQNKSNDMLKFYWGFLAFVVQATGKFGTARALSNALLAEGGYVESFTSLVGGGVNATPMSISDMDDPVFKRFCDNAFAMIAEEFGVHTEDYKHHLRARKF